MNLHDYSELPDEIHLKHSKRIAKRLDTYSKDVTKIIQDEKSGKQLGLKTKYPMVNALFNKYPRFGEITVVSGSSGSGKSYLLNMFIHQFLDFKELNSAFDQKVLVVWCGYENKPENEVLRSIATKMKLSYTYLLSSELIQTTTGLNYNVLTDKEEAIIMKLLNRYSNLPIYHISIPHNIWMSKADILEIASYFPDYKIIVAIDHSQLSTRSIKEKDENDIGINTGIVSIQLKKELDAMIWILNQMNDEIEKPERLKEKSSRNYPKKKDAFGSKQLYQASDNFLFLHKPFKLGINKYGTYGYKTSLLITDEVIEANPTRFDPIKDINKTLQVIHLYQSKHRDGSPDNDVFFLDAFHRGGIIPIPKSLLL